MYFVTSKQRTCFDVVVAYVLLVLLGLLVLFECIFISVNILVFLIFAQFGGSVSDQMYVCSALALMYSPHLHMTIRITEYEQLNSATYIYLSF